MTCDIFAKKNFHGFTDCQMQCVDNCIGVFHQKQSTSISEFSVKRGRIHTDDFSQLRHRNVLLGHLSFKLIHVNVQFYFLLPV